MSELNVWERGNTVLAETDFKVAGSLTDPSGSKVWVDIIKSDGSYLYTDYSAERDSQGQYHVYFSSNAADPLGIYVIVWKAYHNTGEGTGRMPIKQRDAFQLVDVQH